MKWADFKTGINHNGLGALLLRLDKSSALLLAIVWFSALAFVAIASYSLHSFSIMKEDLVATEASQLPFFDTRRSPVPERALTDLKATLLKRYPTLNISINVGKLKISTIDPTLFKQWLVALSYVETISPKYDWTINNLCVGPECKTGLMSAEISGATISFQARQNAAASAPAATPAPPAEK